MAVKRQLFLKFDDNYNCGPATITKPSIITQNSQFSASLFVPSSTFYNLLCNFIDIYAMSSPPVPEDRAMLEELVLDAIIEALTKIKQRNEWMNQTAERTKDEMKF